MPGPEETNQDIVWENPDYKDPKEVILQDFQDWYQSLSDEEKITILGNVISRGSLNSLGVRNILDVLHITPDNLSDEKAKYYENPQEYLEELLASIKQEGQEENLFNEIHKTGESFFPNEGDEIERKSYEALIAEYNIPITNFETLKLLEANPNHNPEKILILLYEMLELLETNKDEYIALIYLARIRFSPKELSRILFDETTIRTKFNENQFKNFEKLKQKYPLILANPLSMVAFSNILVLNKMPFFYGYTTRPSVKKSIFILGTEFSSAT